LTDQIGEQQERRVSTIREEFMKQWFAIALSVGFATALAEMPWLREGVLDWSLPIDWTQVEQMVRLFVAALATGLSWDGYFQSISNKPIEDGPRFTIDVLLVFLYLFLLLTSKFSYFWLTIHAVAFLFYIAWDYLSIRKHRAAYVNAPPASDGFVPTVREVYKGSLGDDPRIYRGPAVTLMWPIYFWTLPLSYWLVLTASDRAKPITTLVYAVWVCLGLLAYRRDKKVKLPFWSRWVLLLGSASAVLGSDLILRVVR